MSREAALSVRRRLLSAALATAVLAAGPVRVTQGAEQGAELETVIEALSSYRAVRASGGDVAAAKADLALRLDALGEALGEPPLSDAAILERLWWSSTERDDRVRAGKVLTETLRSGSFAAEGLEVVFRVPREYDPDERAYPLFVTIPEPDETPAEHLRTHWIPKGLSERVVLVCPTMPEDATAWSRVMIDGRPGGLCHVLMALRFATERFAIDFDRIFVAGRGRAVPVALATGDHAPQRFAGVLGWAGDPGDVGATNFRNLPTLIAGGGPKAKAFAQAVESAGWGNCRLETALGDDELDAWLRDTVRVPYPSRVSIRIGDPFPTRVHWLRVAPMASDANAEATIDRAANRVTVSGSGVAFVTLYLNDELVDLTRPLTVACNGVENAVQPRRSLATWLDLAFDGTCDAGTAYVFEAAFDMTGERTPLALAPEPEPDREYLDRLASVEPDDAPALWSLYTWCLETGREDRAATVLPKVVRADRAHVDARAALGHVLRAGTWFASPAALSRFERSQDADAAAARGWVEHDSVWMHPDDRSRLGKGWTKNWETGIWSSNDDRRRLADGWLRQDFQWVPPAEAGWADEGRFLVDGEWLEPGEADRRHARIENPWRLPDAEVVLHATVERHVALRAREHMSRALVDLRKVFGAEPPLPLEVFVLRDEEQYDRFAFGDPDGARPPTHAGRLHVVHTAFFAESRFPRVDGELIYGGLGVGYWDAHVPYGDLYGVHSVRLAVGLSYVDALDPSPKAVRKALRKGPGPEFYADWRAEKELPDWLRFGGAVYAERFFEDTTVGPDGDPWWARAWSLENLASKGGLRELDAVFACAIDPDDREDGLKLLIETGLVVAFVVDGGVAEVQEAHAELKRALVKGRFHPKDAEALAEAVRAHEAELRAFASVPGADED